MSNSTKKVEVHENDIESKFGDDYSHPAREELKNDKQEFQLPHRHLTKWYLTKRGDEEPPLSQKPKPSQNSKINNNPPLSLKRRYPLPETYKFDETHELRAYMVGKKTSSLSTTENQSKSNYDEAECDARPIVLTDLKHWEIDKSSGWRGIWVKTQSGWYYLKDPCHIAVPRITYFEGSNNNSGSNSNSNSSRHLAQDPYLPAQSSLHMPLRAKLGLLSNLIDIFTESSIDGKSSPNHYAALHAKQSVEKSHKMLCFDSHIMKKKYENIQPPMNDEPFDLLMLQQRGVAEFIKVHLRGLHFTLSEDSIFMKSLTGKNSSLASKTKQQQTSHQEWRENDYRQSALKSEKRSRRESWCEPLPNIDEVRPNQLIELETDSRSAIASTSDREENSSPEKSKKEVEGTAQKILGGDSNHILVLTEKSSFDRDIMFESIEILSAYLLPKSTEEDKKKADYTKFSIEPSKVEEFLQTYVLNEGVLSLELMLLVASAIAKSSDKVMKHLFRIRKSDDSKKTAGSIIFRYWLSYSISVMEKRRHRFSRIKPQMGQIRTEELIAAAIMKLISTFHVIKTSKQINTLKDRYFVDWVDSVEKTLAFANAHNVSDVIVGCKLAMERLENIEGKIGTVSKRSSSEAADEQKKSEPDVKASPGDAKRLRLAKMIEESNKRNKSRSDGNRSAPNGTTDKTSGVSSSVEKSRKKAEEMTIAKIKPEKDRVTNSDKQKGSYSDDERLSRKEEDGLSGLPLSMTFGWKNAPLELGKSKQVKKNNGTKDSARNMSTDGERLSKKEENGLIGLPIYGGWKNSKDLTPSKDDRDSTQSRRNISKVENAEPEKIFSTHEKDGLDSKLYASKNKRYGNEFKSIQPPREVIKSENDVYEKKFTTHEKDGLSDLPFYNEPLENELRPMKSTSLYPEKDGLSDIPFYGSWKNNSLEVTNTRKREHDNVMNGDEKRRRVTTGSIEGSGSRGAGRGRGKDRNKPAWLTRQERNKAPDEGDRTTSNNLQKNAHVRTVSDSTIGNAGRGRGRGRGKDVNKPAWMTKQESNRTLPMSVGTNKNTEPNVQTLSNREDLRSSANIESRDTTRGRGRGKHMNKPAWLTKQESNAKSHNPTEISSDMMQNEPGNGIVHKDNGVVRGRGRGRDINKPAWMTKQQSKALVPDTNGGSSDTRQSAQTRKEPSTLADTDDRNFNKGRGRGRGKDINKPAWLLKQERNTGLPEKSKSAPTDTANNYQAIPNSTVRSSDTVVGTGRGRGKDINKPAWLTKQENSSRSISEPNRSYSNNDRQQPPPSSAGGGGRGRGRGTDNRPAWMTRQSNSSSSCNHSQYDSSTTGSATIVTESTRDVNRDRNYNKYPGGKRSSWVPPGYNKSSTNANSRGYR